MSAISENLIHSLCLYILLLASCFPLSGLSEKLASDKSEVSEMPVPIHQKAIS